MSDFARIEAMTRDVTAWRHEIHRHPGTAFDVGTTAAFVAEKLRGFGLDEVVEGVGRTGVVGVLKGKRAGSRAIGLRADMDALPISEQTNRAYASCEPDKMHACGHDGHTAMLLGAARYLSADARLSGNGRVRVPARRGDLARRRGDDRRPPVRAVPGRHDLWPAQLAGPAGRPLRHAPGPHHGLGRPVRHRGRGARRPCRHASPGRRCGLRGEPDRRGAAGDRGPQHRPSRTGRRVRGRDPGRGGVQRPARHRDPEGHGAGAVAHDA